MVAMRVVHWVYSTVDLKAEMRVALMVVYWGWMTVGLKGLMLVGMVE